MGGLFLLVNPNGRRWWRWKYRRPDSGKENLLSLGVFPDVPLRQARERRDEARKLLADGVDPGVQREAQKQAGAEGAANSFETVAREWLAVKSGAWVEGHTRKIRGWLEQHVFPHIGGTPIAELEAPEILSMLRRLVARGTLNTAGRVREDKEVMAQWLSGPRVLGPNPVDKLFRRRKATKAEKPSESSPKD